MYWLYWQLANKLEEALGFCWERAFLKSNTLPSRGRLRTNQNEHQEAELLPIYLLSQYNCCPYLPTYKQYRGVTKHLGKWLGHSNKDQIRQKDKNFTITKTYQYKPKVGPHQYTVFNIRGCTGWWVDNRQPNLNTFSNWNMAKTRRIFCLERVKDLQVMLNTICPAVLNVEVE